MSKDDDNNNILDFLKERNKRSKKDDDIGDDFFVGSAYRESIVLSKDEILHNTIREELYKCRRLLDSRIKKNYNLMLINISLLMLQLFLLFCYTAVLMG